jgi:transcriptional regulator
MYIPDIYKNNNPEEIRSFLKANAFGILVTHKDGKSVATHIPLEWAVKDNGTEILHAHISKANEQVDHLHDDLEVLCIFNGPHSYVSSSWYDFEEVPTWNYIAVQVRGTITILDEEGLRASVKALMDKYESPQKNPIDMEQLSDKTMRQMNGIIGFELEIKSIEAAYKLSQNRDDKNHTAVVDSLRENANPGEKAIADAMEKQRTS